jgi:hypothetical protein
VAGSVLVFWLRVPSYPGRAGTKIYSKTHFVVVVVIEYRHDYDYDNDNDFFDSLFKIYGVRDYAFSETALGKRGSPAESNDPFTPQLERAPFPTTCCRKMRPKGLIGQWAILLLDGVLRCFHQLLAENTAQIPE